MKLARMLIWKRAVGTFIRNKTISSVVIILYLLFTFAIMTLPRWKVIEFKSWPKGIKYVVIGCTLFIYCSIISILFVFYYNKSFWFIIKCKSSLLWLVILRVSFRFYSIYTYSWSIFWFMCYIENNNNDSYNTFSLFYTLLSLWHTDSYVMPYSSSSWSE